MTVEVSTLDNGLRIASHPMPHLETTSLGLWVAVGARHEAEHEHGLSHLLEHMAFKGTTARTSRAIAEEIEAVGGELNAATSVETTAYFARVLKGDEGVALGILSDILQNSLFAEDELDREKDVILQEIASIQDSPEEIAYDLLQDAAYSGQAIGRPIIGTPESVGGLTSALLHSFLATRYRPEDMILAAAGAIHHDDLLRHGAALFGGLSSGVAGGERLAKYDGGIRVWERPFEQAHYLLGYEGPSYLDADFYTGQVFSSLLGGGMSSRLFQEVRERRGLCYSIYSSMWGLMDTGMLTIHAATGAKSIPELTSVIGDELRALAVTVPDEAEIGRAKAQLKAGLLMALESSSTRAEQMARQLMALGRLMTSSELIQKVDAVTAEGLRQFAAKVIVGRPSIALVGAGPKSQSYADKAQQHLGA